MGAPDDKESYVQEVGIAGRDGFPALALLLSTSKRRRVNRDMQHTQQTILNAIEMNSLMIWIPMCMRIWEQSVCVVMFVPQVV